MAETPIPTSTSADWGLALEAAVCEGCEMIFLVTPGSLPMTCPMCLNEAMLALEEPLESLPYHRPPELVIPFSASNTLIASNIEDFTHGLWFPPADMTAQNLQDRLQRVYLPMWLVDSEVQATWQAEVGFNYEAVSYVEKFDDNAGGWRSQQVEETRLRWEPRLGRLHRRYDNVPSPALEEHAQLQTQLGGFGFDSLVAYQPQAIHGALVRLPNRLPDDSWTDAEMEFRLSAAEECKQACQADAFRDFRWEATFDNQNWTLMLLPIYVTYYLNDNREPQRILIHGQSGRLVGLRQASMQRAQRVALYILMAAVAIFALAVVLGLISIWLEQLVVLAVLGVVLAVMVGFLAIVPPLLAWQSNRTNG